MKRFIIAVVLFSSALAWAGPKPPWVSGGGTGGKYFSDLYLTGFAMVDVGGPEAAKNQAMADLAKRITVRIQHDMTDVTAEKNGAYTYQVASLTRATTDVRLSGLHYETYEEGGRTYALAALHREKGAEVQRKSRDLARERATACIAGGDRHLAAKQEAEALRSYLGCRPHIEEALGAHSLIRTIALKSTSHDDQSERDLVNMSQGLDEKVRTLLRRRVSSLADAIEVVALQLREQGAHRARKVVVAPLTYGTTGFSSTFGRQVSLEIERALATGDGSASTRANHDLVVRGAYVELEQELSIRVTVREPESGRAVAGAVAQLPLTAVPANLELKPKNFQEALKEGRLLGEGEVVDGALRLELWTNKGTGDLVYEEGEELRLYFRVNRPAYVRLVYILTSGLKVPLEQAYFVDTSKVNMAVEYPDAFEITAPYGIERVHAVAFTHKPTPLPTVQRVVDGQAYDVVVDVSSLIGHRGLKRKKAEQQSSEATLSVTTMPKH